MKQPNASKAASTERGNTSEDEPKSPANLASPLRRQSRLVASTRIASSFRRSSTMGMVPLDVVASRNKELRRALTSTREEVQPTPSTNVALLRAVFKAARIAFSRQVNEEMRADRRQMLKHAFLAVFRGVHATLFLAELTRVWISTVKLNAHRHESRKTIAHIELKRSSVQSGGVKLSFTSRSSVQEESGYQARRSKNLLAKRRESFIDPATSHKRSSLDGSGKQSAQEAPAFGLHTLVRRMSMVQSVQRMSVKWSQELQSSVEASEDACLNEQEADVGGDLEESLTRNPPIVRSQSPSPSSAASESSFGSKCPETETQKEEQDICIAPHIPECSVEVETRENKEQGRGRRMSENRVYPELHARSPSLGDSSGSSSSSSSRSSSRGGDHADRREDGHMFTNEYVADMNAKAMEKIRNRRDKERQQQQLKNETEVVPPKKHLISDYPSFTIVAVEANSGFEFVIEDTEGWGRSLCTDLARASFYIELGMTNCGDPEDLNSSMVSRSSMPQTAMHSSYSGPNTLFEALAPSQINIIPGSLDSPRVRNARSAWIQKQAAQQPRILHCIQEGLDLKVAGAGVEKKRSLRKIRHSDFKDSPQSHRDARAATLSPRDYRARQIENVLPVLKPMDQDMSPRIKQRVREEHKLPQISKFDMRDLCLGKASARRHEDKNAARLTTYLAARFQADAARVVLQKSPRRAFALQDPLLC